ncbi:MAG TPA: ABC transporter permease, partial [Polyangiaceae bacterium]
IAEELAREPGVWKRTRTVDGIRFLHLDYQGHSIALKAYDEPDPSLHYWLFDVRDVSRDEAGAALYHSADPTVLVSTNFVLHFGKQTGDSIVLSTPSGATSFRIVGVVNDFASPEGVVYLARDRYKALWHDPLVTAFGLYVAPGADRHAVRAALDARLGREKNLMIILNEELRTEFTQTLDKSFAFTDALESAALFVALIGIFNTLTIGILERTRELGMLRAIGMARTQLARLVFLEAAIQGAATSLLAVVMGGGLGYWLITKSLPPTLGWVLRYDLPLRSSAAIFANGLLVAALAGAFPAWRASRMVVAEALDYE